jgi:hypothetical protein
MAQCPMAEFGVSGAGPSGSSTKGLHLLVTKLGQ